MTDMDRLTDPERRLRDMLQHAIVPPSAPASLHASVDALARPHLGRDRAGGRRWLRVPARPIALFAGAILVTTVTLLVAVAIERRATLPEVAAPPDPPTTTLPTPGPATTVIARGGWTRDGTMWAVDWDGIVHLGDIDGQQWTTAGPMPTNAQTAPQFITATFGFTWQTESVADGETVIDIWVTHDAGGSWALRRATIPTLNGGTDVIAEVRFNNDQFGFLSVVAHDPTTSAGAGEACRRFETHDGGDTWNPVTPSVCLNAGTAWDLDGRTGAAMTGGADIGLTQDAGFTWQTATLPGLTATDRILVRAVGRIGSLVRVFASALGDPSATTSTEPGAATPTAPLLIFETRDGGVTWTRAVDGAAVPIAGPMQAFGPFWLRAVTRGPATDRSASQLLESKDAGATWSSTDLPVAGASQVTWLDSLHGSLSGVPLGDACARSGCGADPTVLFTDDGGVTWHQVPF